MSEAKGPSVSRKASTPLTIAPLQRVVAEPITDPAEQAAIDMFRKREKRKQRGQKTKIDRNGAKAASSSAQNDDDSHTSQEFDQRKPGPPAEGAKMSRQDGPSGK
jgi:hypothetical protein